MTSEKQRRTFLSYSRINKDFALKLAKEMKSAGFQLWIDQLDIPTGARWDTELEKALDECDVFMVILTPASIDSENVKDEIGYAIDHGKRILPVLLEESKVPLRLRRFQYVDFTTKNFDDGIESAKKLLTNLIDTPTIQIPKGDLGAQLKDTQAEAAHQAKQDAEKERHAQARVESERKAKQDADLLAMQKAEADSKAKKETERLTKQKAENKPTPQPSKPAPATTVADPVASKEVVSPPSLNIPLSKPVFIGIGATVIVVLAIILIVAFSGGDNPPTTPGDDQLSDISLTSTQEALIQEIQPTNTPKPTIVPDTPIPTSTPLPSATPTFAPPVTPYVRILEITIDTEQNYVVEYETFDYTEALPGMHIHFFFDTVAPEQAGVPGSGPWIVYGGPRPFTKYTVNNRPGSAMQMCALVANSNHSIQLNSGNCLDLP